MIKSIIKFSSLTLFTLTLIIAPIQQAQAFMGYSEIGSLTVGGQAIVSAGSASGAGPAIAVGLASFAVGAAVGYLGVGYAADGINSAMGVREPLSNKSKNQIPPPSAPATASSSPTCPSGYSDTTVSSGCTRTNTYTFSLNAQNSCNKYLSYTVSPTQGCPSDWSGLLTVVGSIQTYPAGYDSTGHLTNPRLATSDGNVDIASNGNVSGLIGDKDVLSPARQPVISSDGSDVKFAGFFTGSDGQKHPIWVDVQKQNLADATADLYNMEVSYIEHNMGACATDPSCQSLGSTPQDITTQKIAIANGVVTGVSTSTKTGSIAATGDPYINSSGQTATVQPGELIVTTPNTTGTTEVPNEVTTSNPVQPKTQELTLPTDYARQGEAANAARSITDKLAESDPQTDLVEPTLSNPLVDYFNPLRAWSYPNVQGTCPFGSFTWNDHTYSFEAGCTLFSDSLGIIHGVMNVVYALAALFIVLGA